MAERPKISLKLDEPAAFVVKFNSAQKSGVNSGGPWHLWTVSVDDEDWSLFADDELNTLLEGAQLSRGDAVTVTKIKISKGVYEWTVYVNDQLIAPPKDEPAQQPATKRHANGQPANGQQATDPPRETGQQTVTLDDLAQLMERCILHADTAWGQLAEKRATDHTSDNIQATANTLFIEARKNGLTDQEQHPAAAAREAVLAGHNGSQDDTWPGWDNMEPPPESEDGGPF